MATDGSGVPCAVRAVYAQDDEGYTLGGYEFELECIDFYGDCAWYDNFIWYAINPELCDWLELQAVKFEIRFLASVGSTGVAPYPDEAWAQVEYSIAFSDATAAFAYKMRWL